MALLESSGLWSCPRALHAAWGWVGGFRAKGAKASHPGGRCPGWEVRHSEVAYWQPQEPSS